MMNFTGPQVLATALQTPPNLTLAFYPYGIILRRPTHSGGFTEYAVDAAQVAEALAAKTRFETGILSANTLCVIAEGLTRTVVEFRPPQKTALFLDGSEAPLRVPLPGLLMFRTTQGNVKPKYGIFAVQQRPSDPQTKLYLPPLPNVYTNEGAVCWGNVRQVSPEALASNDLREDWRLFLGSMFTAHSVSGKSKSHPQDIRQKLLALEQRKTRVYPKRDLVPCRLTFSEALNFFAKGG
jgi:PRTRC genetic system protein B